MYFHLNNLVLQTYRKTPVSLNHTSFNRLVITVCICLLIYQANQIRD